MSPLLLPRSRQQKQLCRRPEKQRWSLLNVLTLTLMVHAQIQMRRFLRNRCLRSRCLRNRCLKEILPRRKQQLRNSQKRSLRILLVPLVRTSSGVPLRTWTKTKMISLKEKSCRPLSMPSRGFPEVFSKSLDQLTRSCKSVMRMVTMLSGCMMTWKKQKSNAWLLASSARRSRVHFFQTAICRGFSSVANASSNFRLGLDRGKVGI
mmetsp:Transcript_36778/g.68094  ORF Transcript_36778/g.68094 Transcript_36778/m.68094 type:complete len:206 (+) Transcript_36778:157-774(+)